MFSAENLLTHMISLLELERLLSSQYTLKCFVDLAQLTDSPSAAYIQFQSCYQSEFENTDRLVFYSSEIISDSMLEHLYQAADLIDISNCFVLICSPHDLRDRLESTAKSYHNNAVSFQSLQINFESTDKLQNNFKVSDTLCPLPWRSIEVGVSGQIRPCCVYSQAVSNVNNSTLHDAFYGERMSALRQELLEGKKSSGCNHCWERENKGLVSNRIRHLGLLKKDLLTVELDDVKIRSLDLKPGNTCNFKCRICSPTRSSLYEQEHRKHHQIAVKKVNWAEDTTETINEILKLLPSLSNIDMYGGEPFLIKPLLNLVKTAVEQGHASNIRLHYNSNGSVYPSDFIDYWKHFKHIDIQFSIDNTGQRFELERGGSWDQVDSNIRKLVGLGLPNVKISIMPAISIMNIFYIDEVFDWASDLGLDVNPLYVTEPAGFDLRNLTADARELINSKFKNHPWPMLQSTLNYINSTPVSNGQEFIKLCQYFDSLRDQSFELSHPEISKAMGYVRHNR